MIIYLYGPENYKKFLQANFWHMQETNTYRMLHKSQVNRHGVFTSLVNRLPSSHLEQREYTKEYKHILKTAEINGFDKQLIDRNIQNIEAH